MAETSTPTPSAPTPKRKSLFNFKHKATKRQAPAPTPVAASPDQEEDDEEKEKHLDLFRRRKEVFPKAIAEQSQERKLKKEGSSGNVVGDTPPSAKRRKLTPEDNFDMDIYGVSDDEVTKEQSSSTPSKVAQSSPATSVPRDKGKAPEVAYSLTKSDSRLDHSAPIELSDDDDDDVQPTPSRGARRTRRNGANSAIVSDDEANENPVDRSMTARADDLVDDEDEAGDSVEEVEDEFLAKHYQAALARKEAAKSHAQPSLDPSTPRKGRTEFHGDVVKVIVRSRIPWVQEPRVQQIVFNIRTDQPLKKVLDAYIAKLQPECIERRGIEISKEEASSICLTFGKTIIFPSTTLEMLTLDLDDNGRIPYRSPGWKSKPHTGGGTVVLECYYQKVFENLRKVQDEEKAREDDMDSDDDEPVAQEETNDDLRIFLKSDKGEPLKLTAHPTTTVRQLISVYRQQRQIGPDKRVTIHWDGQRLEEEVTMADAEVEDEDVLDVHID